MFNIDFGDKRVKSTLRTLQYTALTILVVVGTIILVFAGQGYDLDTKTGKVIKNGLILVNSTPEDATVYIDGQPESDTTPGSFPVPDGHYDVSISRPGYRDWHKSVSVTGSEVEWLYYPLLIPSQLDSRNLTVFLKPEFVGISASGDKLLVRRPSSKAVFSLVTFSSSGVTDEESLELPGGLLKLGGTKTIGKFGFEGWASDNRHILLTHTVGSKIEYIWLDSQTPASSRNLTQDLDLDLRQVRFINGNSQQLYTLVNSDIRRINLSNDTISTPLVRDVGRYVLYKDRFVVYISNTDSGSQLGLIEDNNPPQVLRTLPNASSQYRLEFAEFDNVFYLGLLDVKAGQLNLIANPNLFEIGTVQTPLIFNLDGANYVNFSRNGQFIVIQSGQRFLTYDLDRKRRSSFKLDFAVTAKTEAKWLDGYRMSLPDKTGMLHLFEFDGANATDLVAINPTYDPIYNAGQNVLYTLSPTADGGRIFFQGTNFTVVSQ